MVKIVRCWTCLLIITTIVDISCQIDESGTNLEYVKSEVYRVDDTRGTGRRFDGIGAISGGGATSKLLVNYPLEIRNQILDYLFKPNFGASLQILKVEIGGDSQSSDGSESSHMHTATDENYQRGYEWWLMKEAKKRRPDIKLYGLPWVFPGWLGGNSTKDPYYNNTALAHYIINWIHGAKVHHDLDIDYIGIWNERPVDINYVKLLRDELDKRGYSKVMIVAPDSASWDLAKAFLLDRKLSEAIDIIGIHYPGSRSPNFALATDRPLWASEEYSARNDLKGGGCWARVLNEGYVSGFFTATIAWNLIASYYDDLKQYTRFGLMTANQPWSGHYDVASPIWITAHHTQFYQIGWHYLLHEHGVGRLHGNGTYISLTSPAADHLTIIIETLDPQDAPCFYWMPQYHVASLQIATFNLTGSYENITQLEVWYSSFNYNNSESTLFQKKKPIQVKDGQFTLTLKRNEVYTLTTVTSAKRGVHPEPPGYAPFPVPYSDDFESYQLYEEPYNFAQQSAAFEVRDSHNASHGKVMTQVVPAPPVDTCRPEQMPRPITLIGNYNWSDVDVTVDVYIPSPPESAMGVFLAARVEQGGCWLMYRNGIYFWLLPANQTILLTGNYSQSAIYFKKDIKINYQTWYTMRLVVKGNSIMGYVDQNVMFHVTLPVIPVTKGFIALGTDNFARADFDNFRITEAREYVNSTIKPAEHHGISNTDQDVLNATKPAETNRISKLDQKVYKATKPTVNHRTTGAIVERLNNFLKRNKLKEKKKLVLKNKHIENQVLEDELLDILKEHKS